MACAKYQKIQEQAKENERRGGGSGSSGRQNSDNPIDTKQELAKMTGLSTDTVSRAKYLEENAPEEVFDKSVNQSSLAGVIE